MTQLTPICGNKYWQVGMLLLLCVGREVDVVAVATAEEPSSPLRVSTIPKNVEHEWERLSVVRRVYGEHNALVRKNVRNIEESMPRYQTGVPPDPSHEVPYENHPYDKKSKNRLLQTENVTEISNEKSSRFQPIRMHFETVALNQQRDREANNAAKIECKEPMARPSLVFTLIICEQLSSSLSYSLSQGMRMKCFLEQPTFGSQHWRWYQFREISKFPPLN